MSRRRRKSERVPVRREFLTITFEVPPFHVPLLETLADQSGLWEKDYVVWAMNCALKQRAVFSANSPEFKVH